jgi:hypothetical protein
MAGEIISRGGNVDIGNGVILRYDEKEKEMVGMTIIGLKGMLNDFAGVKE